MATVKNPFTFGSVVTDKSFINRTDSIKFVQDVMASNNHLVLIAPRRYGKTSLALKATADLHRPVININFQNVIDEMDLARQLIKATLKYYPLQKIKYAFSHFSIVPIITTDPISGNFEIAISPSMKADTAIDDAFRLVEKAGEQAGKPIVIFDEFQDANNIAPDMLKRLRSIMQLQNNVNYILLGSMESMMREIFEKKKSPFYHFGVIMHLSKLPFEELLKYLNTGFALCRSVDMDTFSREILEFTNCHPYYTQELAFYAWNELKDISLPSTSFIQDVIQHAVARKDYDYERLWSNLNSNNKRLIKALALNKNISIYSKEFIISWGFNATSTVRGCINKMMKEGYIVQNELDKSYRVEDPFFAQWLRNLL